MSTVRIQVRRGVAADWTSVNPILAAGEMGYETDTNKFKFGNGTGAWSTLSYGASDTPGVTEIAQDAINAALAVGTGLTKTYNDGANTITVAIDDAVWANKTYVDEAVNGLQNTSDATYLLQDDRGTAGGVASLDNSGHVPSDQIASSTVRSLINVSGAGINYDESTGGITLDFSNTPAAIASKNYVTDQVSNIVNNAPGALDTLLELSSALGDDANFATTVTNSIATKSPIASPTFTGTVTIPAGASIAGYDLITAREGAITSALALAEADATTKANAAANTAITDAAAAAASTYVPLEGITERITDTAAEMIAVGSGNGLTRTWDDASNSLTLNVDQAVIATVARVATSKQEAIDAAATDATTKAQDAITTAAADATTKAGNAQTAAIAAAGQAADTKVSDHNALTENVHGILDTAALATKTYADTAVSNHSADTTFVHGIADTSVLETVTGSQDKADAAQTAAIAAAAGLYATKANASITGTATVENITVTGNLTVQGTTTTVDATNLEVTDSLIYLASEQFDTDALDIGIFGAYGDVNAGHLHTGMVRDASDGKWKLISNGAEPTTSEVDFSGVTYDTLKLGGVEFSDGTQTKQGVPSLTTIIQKTAGYTLSALTERDSMIEMNSSSATTLTVPTNATIAYPIGTSIDILRVGAGAVDVAAAAGVTINATPGLKLRAQWSSATLVKRATDTWVLLGDLSA